MPSPVEGPLFQALVCDNLRVFYYYGRKAALAGRYPDPAFDTIIEPFAGSAAYSLHGRRWEREVILVERDPQIADLWRWLIEEARPADVLAIPEVHVGESVTHPLVLLHASSKRWFTYRRYKATRILADNWNRNRRRIAQDLHKVKHWRVRCGDYEEAPVLMATWFIDPPYSSEAGTGYRYGSERIDYERLAVWCKGRPGHVLVCEGQGASWLPFSSLCSFSGVAGKKHQEMLWVRSNIGV